MEFVKLLKLVDLMNLVLNLSYLIDSQAFSIQTYVITYTKKCLYMGREFNFCDFVENMLKISLHLDAWKLIYSKLGLMIHMTKLYILMPV